MRDRRWKRSRSHIIIFCGRCREMCQFQQMVEICQGFGAYSGESLTLMMHTAEVTDEGF